MVADHAVGLLGATSVGLFAGVIVGWLWVTAFSWRFIREGQVTAAGDR